MRYLVTHPRMDVVEECFGGEIALRVRGLQARGITEFIPTVSVESQHSTGGPTCHDFPRFVIISEKSIPEVRNR